jgi:hypothetical protein
MIKQKETLKKVLEQYAEGKSYTALKKVTTTYILGVPVYRSERILSHNV